MISFTKSLSGNPGWRFNACLQYGCSAQRFGDRKKSDLDITVRKFLDISGKLNSLFSLSHVFITKLCMYVAGLEFLGHLVVTVSRTSAAKLFSHGKIRAEMSNLWRELFFQVAISIDGNIFLNHVGEPRLQINMQILIKNVFYVTTCFGWENPRQNVECMTRIMFLVGHPNRRQDIFKLCRRAPAPSKHANIDQNYMLCDDMFRMRKRPPKCWIYDQNYFSRWRF